MTRRNITRKRASMILIVFVTFVYFSDLTPNKMPINISTLLFGAGWIISIVYWISGEIEWSKINSNISNTSLSKNIRTNNSISKTIKTMAAIGTIITTAIILLKECN